MKGIVSTGTLAARAAQWEGPHFRIRTCGTNNFHQSPPPYAMFLDALEPQGCWEYVLSGVEYYRVGSERYRVEAGEALVTCRPDRGWLLRPVKDVPIQTVWLSVIGEPALQMFGYLHMKYGQIQKLPAQSEAVRLARKLVQLVIENPRRDPHFWSEKTFQWMNAWWQTAQESSLRPNTTQLGAIEPSRMISDTPKTIKNLAGEMGYSRAYLSRKLTQQWKKSPGKVLREMRLDDASTLLRSTRLSVGEVAAKVGYDTAAGFCRAFLRRFEQSPRVYRRSHR